jgi:hypothetical protein
LRSLGHEGRRAPSHGLLTSHYRCQCPVSDVSRICPSERNLRVLRVDLPVGSQLSDRPLFNAAGEAVAILVGSPNTKDSTSFALALDGIDELMARAGVDR